MFRFTLTMRRFMAARPLLAGVAHSGGGRPPQSFHAFTRREEEELVRVISTKPRHVLKHVRQLVWRGRKRELHFRNTVTQLMIVTQDHLRKKQLDPAHASAIMEGVLEECVKLQQHDMAHLLFRAFIRFRKYGCTVSVDALRHLFESYKNTDKTELMLQLAAEMGHDPELRAFCIAAYLFAGEVEEAEKLRASVPLTEMTPLDIVAIIEGYDKCGMLRERSMELLESLTALRVRGEELVPIYRSAIRLCWQRDDLEGLQRVLELVKQQGVPLDNAMFANILRLRMKHARSTEDLALIEAELAEEGYTPDITGNSIIISAHSRLVHYGDKGSEEIMLGKVETLLSSIESRLQAGDPDMDVTGAHLRAVIRGFGAAGRPELIRQAWSRMQCKGVSDNPRVYNELLKWYALMGNVKDVLATKDEMDTVGVKCDTIGYSWIFRALGRYYPRHVNTLYDEMSERRVRIDMPLYTTLVGIFGDLGRMERVAEIEGQVLSREEAGTLQTTPLYFSQLLRVYAYDLPRVVALHSAAAAKGFLEHQHVVTTLLHAYANHEEGHEKLQELLASLPHPWTTETFNVLLNMHGRAGDGEKLKELLVKMRRDQVPMDDVTFGTLVTAFGRLGDVSRVREVIATLRERDGQVSSSFYSVLAATLSRLGDAQGISDAWADLLSSKLVVDTHVYNQFLTLYGRHHNVAGMQDVMDTMLRQVPPNPVTATTVLDVLGKSGRIAEMEALLADMKASVDAKPTAVTYHQVLNAYAKTGDVPKMERLYEEMVSVGIAVDSAVTYNILADGYGRAKRFEQLEELLRRRAVAGVPMDELGYCILISSYGRIRSQPDIVRLASALREAPQGTNAAGASGEQQTREEVESGSLDHVTYPAPGSLVHLRESKKVCWVLVDAACRCRDFELMKEWVREVERLAANESLPADANGQAAKSLDGIDGAADMTSEMEPRPDDNLNGLPRGTTPGSSRLKAGDADRMALIAYYCRAGLMDEAERLVADLETRTELSYSALNALARGFAMAGAFDKTVAVLHQMRDREFVPDASTAIALSSSFLKAGLHDQAQQIVQWRRRFAAAVAERTRQSRQSIEQGDAVEDQQQTSPDGKDGGSSTKEAATDATNIIEESIPESQCEEKATEVAPNDKTDEQQEVKWTPSGAKEAEGKNDKSATMDQAVESNSKDSNETRDNTEQKMNAPDAEKRIIAVRLAIGVDRGTGCSANDLLELLAPLCPGVRSIAIRCDAGMAEDLRYVRPGTIPSTASSIELSHCRLALPWVADDIAWLRGGWTGEGGDDMEVKNASNLSHLVMLQRLRLVDCSLEWLPPLPPGLLALSLVSCNNSIRLGNIAYLSVLSELEISGRVYVDLSALPTRLRSLSIIGCRGFAGPTNLSRFSRLRRLVLTRCGLRGFVRGALPSGIESLKISSCTGFSDQLDLSGVSALKLLHLADCDVTAIVSPPPGLTDVRLLRCAQLASIYGFGQLGPLELELVQCPVAAIAAFPHQTMRLVLQQCPGVDLSRCILGRILALTSFTLSDSNIASLPELPPGLSSLSILRCPNLTAFGDLSYLCALEFIECTDGRITALRDLPASLCSIAIVSCPDLIAIGDLSHLRSLSVLKLAMCASLSQLPKLPPSLLCLTATSCVKLVDLGDVRQLTRLKWLDLSRAGMASLSGELLPASLVSLNLSSCASLARLAGLQHLTALIHLNLSRCGRLGAIEGCLPGQLRTLRLDDCAKLGELFLGEPGTGPGGEGRGLLRGMACLEELSVSGTNITSFGHHQGDEARPCAGCMRLTRLCASACPTLRDLGELRHMGEIVRLELSGSALVHFPGAVALPVSLKAIDLSGCEQLTELGDMSGLDALEELRLTLCVRLLRLSLGHLPLGRLRSLDCARCYRLDALTTACPGATCLPAIEHLSLNATAIQTLPLLDAPRLRSLDLARCTNLERLEEQLAPLLALEHLDVSHSATTALGNLPPRLISLDASHCPRLAIIGSSPAPWPSGASTNTPSSGAASMAEGGELGHSVRGCRPSSNITILRLLKKRLEFVDLAGTALDGHGDD